MTFALLNDDCVFGVLRFLDVCSLVRSSSVSRRWQNLVDSRHLAWEGALAELDPFGDLGAAGFMAAVRGGLGCLEIAERLGVPLCACGEETVRFSRDDVAFICNACQGGWLPNIFSRYVFARGEKVRVANELELRAAAARYRHADGAGPLATIVITADIELTRTLNIRGVRLMGGRVDAGATKFLLRYRGGSVIHGYNYVLDNLLIMSGHEEWMPAFGAVENSILRCHDDDLAAYREAAARGEFYRAGGGLVIENCHIVGHQGSCVIVAAAAAAIFRSTLSTDFLSIACHADDDTHRFDPSPSFMLSVYSSKIRGSIGAGDDVLPASQTALVAVNTFTRLDAYNPAFSGHLDFGGRGRVQPWRSGCLRASETQRAPGGGAGGGAR
jgi:hypothetical protein